MSRRLIAAVGLMALGLVRSGGQESGRLIFQAKVSDLLLGAGSLARNKAPNDTVRITLPGHRVLPPRAVPLIRRADAKWDSPEAVVESIRSANTAGDATWILENFAPGDQAEVSKLLGEPDVAKRNLDYYKTVSKSDVTALIEFRSYTILLVREETSGTAVRTVPMTFVKTPTGWKQTNALSKDETFDVVWAASRNGTMQ